MIWIIGSVDRLASLIDQPLLDELRSRGVPFHYIEKAREDARNPRSNLDKTQLWSTHALLDHWAFAMDQAATISAGDRVVFCDFWNPAVLAFDYARWAKGLDDVKIFGIYAASSGVVGDFAGNLRWARDAEESWSRCYDELFFASEYARHTASHMWSRHEVTGLPFTPPTDEVLKERGPNSVLMPHRSTPDKFPSQAVDILRRLPSDWEIWSAFPIEGVNCSIVGPWSEALMTELQQTAKYVFCPGSGETFGYAWMEAVCHGCIPIARDAGCYSEFIEDWCRYNSVEEAVGLFHANRQVDAQKIAEEFRDKLSQFEDVPRQWAARITEDE